MPERLSIIEQDTLLLLGCNGSGADFDQIAMSKLFLLGLVEVSAADRSLILTGDGRRIFDLLSAPGKRVDGESSVRPRERSVKNTKYIEVPVGMTLDKIAKAVQHVVDRLECEGHKVAFTVPIVRNGDTVGVLLCGKSKVES